MNAKKIKAAAMSLAIAAVLASCSGQAAVEEATRHDGAREAMAIGESIAAELIAEAERATRQDSTESPDAEPMTEQDLDTTAYNEDEDQEPEDGEDASMLTSGSTVRQFDRLASEARSLIGAGHNILGMDPQTGFSSMSFITWVLRQAGIMDLKVMPAWELKTRCLATRNDMDGCLPGDLVFLGDDYYMPDSCGIYTGVGKMVICGPYGVTEESIDGYHEPFVCIGRVCLFDSSEEESMTEGPTAAPQTEQQTEMPTEAATQPIYDDEPSDGEDMEAISRQMQTQQPMQPYQPAATQPARQQPTQPYQTAATQSARQQPAATAAQPSQRQTQDQAATQPAVQKKPKEPEETKQEEPSGEDFVPADEWDDMRDIFGDSPWEEATAGTRQGRQEDPNIPDIKWDEIIG